MYFHSRTYPLLVTVILLGGVILAFMQGDARLVVAPGFACAVIMLWLVMMLWDRDRIIPIFDAGVICGFATMVYTVYPLMNYWLGGFQFGFLSDNRLQLYSPTPMDMGLFHLRHVLYLFSFVVSYLLIRSKSPLATGNVVVPSRPERQIIFLSFALLTIYFLLLQLVTGVNYNSSYEEEGYFNNLAAFSNAPLLLLQVSGKLWGILFISKLALLFIVVNRCRQKRWLFVLLAWIAVEIIQALIIRGARTSLVLFLMAVVLYYHRMIKPFTIKCVILSGLSVFTLFIFLGFYRMYFDLAAFQLDLLEAGSSIFSAGNEFQSLLGNAYDVLQRKEEGVSLPWYLYLNDFITILPPQQLLPFEKVPASEWYLREIGLSETGLGLMWGVITQSIIGLDWIELAIRGGILGFLLGKLHSWYVRNQSSFLANLLYVYLCLRVYYTFRDTTFSLLANLIWEVIPFYLLLKLGISLQLKSNKNSSSADFLATSNS